MPRGCLKLWISRACCAVFDLQGIPEKLKRVLVFFPQHLSKGRCLMLEEPGGAGSQLWTWRPEPGAHSSCGVAGLLSQCEGPPSTAQPPPKPMHWGLGRPRQWLVSSASRLKEHSLSRTRTGRGLVHESGPQPLCSMLVTVSSASCHCSVSFSVSTCKMRGLSYSWTTLVVFPFLFCSRNTV